MSSRSIGLDFHPARNPLVRLNGICPYFTMYPLPFPYTRLKSRGRNIRVLDPFCGRGTTNFAARLLGMESVGIDSNPVAHAVAQSKLVHTTKEDVTRACKAALAEERDADIHVPKGDFWSLCYHEETLIEICQLRNFFLHADQLEASETMLRAIMVGILHGPQTKSLPTYLSSQMPRTYATKPASAVNYWRKHGHEPVYVSVSEAVSRRAEYLLMEIPRVVPGEARKGDSRHSSTFEGLRDFDLVLTSPPYLGMRTYWPDQWLRNWFLGGPDYVEYSKADQIQSQDLTRFTKDLSLVWKHSAKACRKGAKMIIRFGALPSYNGDPRATIKESLRLADCGWIIDTIRDAGAADIGRRQAEQFQTKNNNPIREIDVYCTSAA